MIEAVAIGGGDIVTVLAVPTILVKDLPDGERTFLLSLVGEDVTVSETAPRQWIEIEAYDEASGITHFLRLAEVDVCRRASSPRRTRSSG
ncbi:hypothetical protein [Rhizobium leguminosarum]|uniref:hypothetical protein n=1 Tax=Rhizobium leguminosarum TaxID=384 RepID=UPI002E0F9950|nr:hypothetical protein U8Q02_41970 [Rhizobium leguminosarum]